MLWVDNKLKEVFGADDPSAMWLTVVMFCHIIVITCFAVVFPSKNYPQETLFFFLSIIFFMFCATSNFFCKEKLKTSEKIFLEENQSSDKKRISGLEAYRVFLKEEHETEKHQIELSSRYGSIVMDNILLQSQCQALQRNRDLMSWGTVKYSMLWLENKLKEVIGEDDSSAMWRYSALDVYAKFLKEQHKTAKRQKELSSRNRSIVRDNIQLQTECLALIEENRDLKEKVSFLNSQQQNGMPPSTEAEQLPQRSKNIGNKVSADSEGVKFTLDPEDVEFDEARENYKAILRLQICNRFPNYEGLKTVLRPQTSNLLADIETVKSATDPNVVKFTADSETVKFSGSEDSRGVAFAANGQDLQSEDPKEGEWEVIDANLRNF